MPSKLFSHIRRVAVVISRRHATRTAIDVSKAKATLFMTAPMMKDAHGGEPLLQPILNGVTAKFIHRTKENAAPKDGIFTLN